MLLWSTRAVAFWRTLNPLYKRRPHFVAGENCPYISFLCAVHASCSPLSCLESLKPVKGTLYWQEGVCRLHHLKCSLQLCHWSGDREDESVLCVVSMKPKKRAEIGRGLKKNVPPLCPSLRDLADLATMTTTPFKAQTVFPACSTVAFLIPNSAAAFLE